ncbi:MAG: type II secretion system protein [Gammaproteobacteria bacterium]|nr:type II secretion system protein [Gammaproteobacteria bacterium]
MTSVLQMLDLRLLKPIPVATGPVPAGLASAVRATPIGSSGRPQRGFTLIEIVVVLAVIAALMGVLLPPLGTQVRMRQMRDEEVNLQRIHDALLGFAQTNGHFPCPDTLADGNLDGEGDYSGAPGGARCQKWEPASPLNLTEGFGLLPYRELGLPPTDRWGHRHYYRVTEEYAYRTVAGAEPALARLDLLDAGALEVKDRSDVRDGVVADDVAVVVLSTGISGYCGYDPSGDLTSHGLDTGGDCPPNDAPWSSSDEGNNLKPTSKTFYARIYTEGTSGCDDTDPAKDFCHFDDQLIWLPASIIKTRLIDAGRLP